MITKRNLHRWLVIHFLVTAFLPLTLFAESGDDNPTGVAGAFNGQITTGSSYDPFTGNMQRQIDDIVVPGSVGAYPLKWTRYWNSHTSWRDGAYIGASWRFSYAGYQSFGDWPGNYPDGRTATDEFGVEDTGGTMNGNLGRILSDGGVVMFQDVPWNGELVSKPVKIIDPYGQVTTISYVQIGHDHFGYPITKLDRITEPGGRYLQIIYDSTDSVITRVEAYDGVNPQPIDWVNYRWKTATLASELPGALGVIDQVTYSDGTTANYTYKDGEYLGPPLCTTPDVGRGHWHAPQLSTADDPRYPGPMRQIAYTYNPDNYNQTRIASENHAILVNGQLTAGEPVSTTAGASNKPSAKVPTTVSETRGDGAARTFTYNSVTRCSNKDCPPPNPDTQQCQAEPDPLDGKLLNFTDFLGHKTTLTYRTDAPTVASANGFITGVTDPNGHTTNYERQTNSWGITKITHPDGSTIQQTFWPTLEKDADSAPWYLASRTDELGHTTIYTRDAKMRITRKDYPNDADEPASYETFTYNTFGEVLTHRMTSGGTESFVYDSRGLKTSHTDALTNVTTYTYYPDGDSTLAPWTDRLKKVTYPANASGLQATETYEYDRDSGGNPVAGRGLVTKITHTDGTFVTNIYNKYGDLLSTTDELGHTTTNTYDDYGRVLTTTTPPRFAGDTQNHTTTIGYVPTHQASSYVTTSKLPFSTTLPSGKQTTFEYDFNWRKTWVHQAPNTSDTADTQFMYDQYTSTAYGNYTSIGNLLATIDPRNNVTAYHYDIRYRQDSVTDPLGHTTSFTFDFHGNKLTETHANNELIEYDRYDAMNRLRHQRVHRDDTTTPPTIDQSSSTYDAAGNLDTHTDEDGNIYNYDYDAMNRPTQISYPNAKTEVHTYDAVGNVQTYTNRSGATQRFDYPNSLDSTKTSYDNRNRLKYFGWSDGTSSQATAYDAASRKTQIVNSDATINFAYYNDNKLWTQEEWVTAPGVGDNMHRTVTYTYDPDGNRAAIQYPSGTKFDYDYTQRNQVADIKLDGQMSAIVSYAFDASGNITTRTLDNNTSTAYTVDAGNRDTSIAHALTGGPKRFDYVYNEVNDIKAVERDASKGDAYEYDLTQEIKRLAQNGNVDLTNGTITSPSADTNMTFDGCGNQKSLNGGGTFQVNNLNQYTTYNGAALTYDNNGNTVTYDGWTYTYDAQNRLRQASGASVTENFYYDGLNRQVARVTSGGAPPPTPTPTPTPISTPSPSVSPLPTISPLPSVPPTPTVSPSVPSLSPTPTIPPLNTPTPPPTQQCAPVTFSKSCDHATGQCAVSMSTTPSGATIFYTTDGSTPTHNGSTPTGTTTVYTGPLGVGCNAVSYKALAYRSDLLDSNVTSYNDGGGIGCPPPLGPMMSSSQTTKVTIFSIWDGDWAILEEYDGSGNRIEAYVEGYHGLVKTLVSNIYYYQDELGSTSHVASATGSLIENYQYDVYGKPRVYDSGGNFQPGATPVAKDLFTGQRWHSELGLYDDRNRFMSPDLGRFLQPDPIGFKGDASNLYRYCGNDWANRADMMGTEATPMAHPDELQTKELSSRMRDDRSFQEKLSASEVEHQVNVDSQHAGNTAHARTEVKQAKEAREARKDQQLKFSSLNGTKWNSNPWEIRWGLMHASTNGGWIVQHIEADFESGGKFNYWEAWQVMPGSRFTATLNTYGLDDMFRGPKGSEIHATARFYEGLKLPSSFVFQPQGFPAGDLRATTVNPHLSTANATEINNRWWDAQ